MTRLLDVHRILLEIVSQALFPCRAHLPPYIDYDSLYNEAMMQAVLPLVYSVIKTGGVMLPNWEKTYAHLLAQNMAVDYEHVELGRLLQNIPYAAIKGSISASYYPEPFLRTMGDVDFIVYQKDMERAGNILKKSGFIRTEDYEHEAHIAYHRQPNSVWEMHWCLSGIPQSSKGDQARTYDGDIIEKAVTVDTLDGTYQASNTFHHGMVMLIHTAGHMINTGIGLRHLCDWAVFINQTSDFDELFRDKLRECGLWRFAQLLTQLSTVYLRLPEQRWAMVDVDYDLLESMICDIFAGGNFGQKDSERINQAKLMTDKGKGGVDHSSMVRQLISVMNEKSRIAMPVCKRIPILLPIGWVYVGGRHLIRIKDGTRPKIHVKAMIEGADERREIYAKFKLYEKE